MKHSVFILMLFCIDCGDDGSKAYSEYFKPWGETEPLQIDASEFTGGDCELTLPMTIYRENNPGSGYLNEIGFTANCRVYFAYEQMVGDITSTSSTTGIFTFTVLYIAYPTRTPSADVAVGDTITCKKDQAYTQEDAGEVRWLQVNCDVLGRKTYVHRTAPSGNFEIPDSLDTNF